MQRPGKIGLGAAFRKAAAARDHVEIAEMVDPTREDAYWRDNYASRPYVSSGSSYDDYGPAYRYGVDAYGRSDGKSFDDAEAEMGRNWNDAKGVSSLGWERAKEASRDSWQRASNTIRK